MKPAWDKLGTEYADSSSVLIGDADCTASGKALCEAHSVRGYPTIKYFDAEGSHDYSGGRDFDGLKKFVEENLEVKCTPETKDDAEKCTAKQKKYIEKWAAKSKDDVEKQLKRLKGMQGKKMAAKLKKWLAFRIQIQEHYASQK